MVVRHCKYKLGAYQLLLAFALIGIVVLPACSFDASISRDLSKKQPLILSHEINEIKINHVQIALSGECSVVADQVLVEVEGQKLINNKSKQLFDIMNEQETVAYCDPTTKKLFVNFAVQDPNRSRDINIKISLQFDKSTSDSAEYTVKYTRPPIPKAVITTNNGENIITNNTTPTLEGKCVEQKIEAIEIRIDNGAWQTNAITCVNGEWQINLPVLNGSPPTAHVIEIRTVNTNSSDVYSEVEKIEIYVDTDAPTTGPTVVGIIGGADITKDTWLGALTPHVYWTHQNEYLKYSVQIKSDDNSTNICNIKTVLAPTDHFEFKNEDCDLNLTNATSYTVNIWGYDTAGNMSSIPTQFTFTVDRTSPAINITTNPAITTKAINADFNFVINYDTGSPQLDSPQRQIDNLTFTNCNGTQSYTNLSVGAHTFKVRATDSAGNSTQQSYSWTIEPDGNAPICNFTSPNLTYTNLSTVTIDYNCSDDDLVSKVECKINSGQWQNCPTVTSTVLNGLTSGTYKFSVRAKDQAQNISNEIFDEFIVDQEAPSITFTLTPQDPTNLTQASFSFNALDLITGIQDTECNLDSTGFSNCGSPYFITGPLSEGNHTLYVRAIDLAGNISTSSVFSWNIDTTSPPAPILPADTDGGRKPLWTWSSGGGGGNGQFRFKIDDNDLTTGATLTTDLFFQTLVDLSFGAHTIYVQERDAAGNWSASGDQTLTIKCSSGTFLSGANCELCPAGTYQTSPNLDSSCTSASTGYFVSSMGAVTQTACTNKPNNAVIVTYSASTGLTSNNCPVATVSSCDTNYTPNANECRALCSGGQYWDGSLCSNVGIGYYSPNFDDSRYTCPTNSTTLSTNSTSLSDCLAVAGYYGCQDGTCDQVGAGYYSPTNDNTRYVCPTNSTTTSTTASSVTDCLADAGYYNCEDGTCDPVGVGYYSPTNDNSRYSCPLNRTTSSTTATSQSACLAVAGYYGSDTSIAATAVGAGYYSPQLDNSRYLCSAGSYCSSTTNSVATGDGICSGGYYCPTGSTSALGAPSGGACPAGYECPAGTGELASASICADGSYSLGTAASCTTCPANSTALGVLASDHDSASDCKGAAGYYDCQDATCDVVGAGYYSPAADNNRYQCQAGYFGSSTTNSVSTCDGACAPGYYCLAGSTSSQGTGVCNANTYSTGSATSASCNACPANSVTNGAGATNHDNLNDCLGVAGYYNCEDGNCDFAGFGFYSPTNDNTRYACPANSSTATMLASSLSECLGNAGYYNCSDTTCDSVGTDYYSPSLDDTRYACPANSYTTGTGTGADSVDDCLAGVDYWDHDTNNSTDPVAVGAGFFSAYRDDTRTVCTNKPANATSVTYSTSGGGTNNCTVSAVIACDVGFAPNGTSCSDNSPGSITFTNLSGVDRSTTNSSNAVSVSGFDGPLTATCSNCTAIARNGSWGGTSVAGFMPGDTIAIRATASSSFSTAIIATVSLGSTTSSNWSVTTRAGNSCTSTPWGTLAHGDTRTGYSTATPLPAATCASSSELRSCNDGILSGTYTITSCNNGCSSTPWGNVIHGYNNTAYSASANPNCAAISETRTCTNGTLSGSYTNTTCTDNAPNAFSFTNLTNQSLSSTITSNAVTLGGFDGPLTATCTGCSAIARNGSWGGTSVAGFMSGDTITIRVTSSGSFATAVNATATVGVTTSTSWSVTTRTANNCTGTPWGTVNHGSSVTAYSSTTPTPPTTCAGVSESRTCNDGTLSGSFTNTSCNAGCSSTPWGNVTHGYSNTAYSTTSPTGACSGVSQTRTCTNGTMSGTYTNTTCNNGCTGTPWGSVAHGYSNTAYSTGTPTAACSTVSQTRTCTNGTMSGSYTVTSCNSGCTSTPWGNVAHGYSNTAYTSTTPAGACTSFDETRTCTNGTLSGSYTATTCTNGCTGTPWGSVAHGYSNTAYTSTAPAGACSSFSETRTCSSGSMSGSYTATSCTNGCTGTPWGNVSNGYSNTAYSTSSPTAACSTVSQTRTCTSGTLSGSYTVTSCNSGCTSTPWGNVAHGYSNTAYSASTAPDCSAISQTRTCTSGALSGSYTFASCTNSSPCNLPWGGQIAHGASVTAYASPNPTYSGACTSESRTCSNGTLSGSYTNQNCTRGCAPATVNGKVLGNGYNGQIDSIPRGCDFPYRACEPGSPDRFTCSGGNTSSFGSWAQTSFGSNPMCIHQDNECP